MRILLPLLLLLSTGCDRLFAEDAPPPVAPISPPQVVIESDAPPGSHVFVDGADRGSVDRPVTVELAPGSHAFELRRDDRILARVERSVASGETVTVRLDPPRDQAPAAAGAPAAAPAAGSAGVTLGAFTLEAGDLTEAAVTRTFRARIRAIQRCYEDALEDGRALDGVGVLRVEVGSSGTVTRAEFAPPEPVGGSCIERLTRRIRFDVRTRSAFTQEMRFVRPAGPSAAPTSATPSRGDVVAAMRAVEPLAQACGRGGGTVLVRFTFRGHDGRVERVEVPGDLPEARRACLERASQAARVPPFTRPSFDVRYPLRL